jgi:hypothetical protein
VRVGVGDGVGAVVGVEVGARVVAFVGAVVASAPLAPAVDPDGAPVFELAAEQPAIRIGTRRPTSRARMLPLLKSPAIRTPLVATRYRTLFGYYRRRRLENDTGWTPYSALAARR